MSHFAKVTDGKVTQVIVAEKEFFDTYVDSTPGEWIQTSYNTQGGKSTTQKADHYVVTTLVLVIHMTVLTMYSMHCTTISLAWVISDKTTLDLGSSSSYAYR
jgi:hypothetical protein